MRAAARSAPCRTRSFALAARRPSRRRSRPRRRRRAAELQRMTDLAPLHDTIARVLTDAPDGLSEIDIHKALAPAGPERSQGRTGPGAQGHASPQAGSHVARTTVACRRAPGRRRFGSSRRGLPRRRALSRSARQGVRRRSGRFGGRGKTDPGNPGPAPPVLSRPAQGERRQGGDGAACRSRALLPVCRARRTRRAVVAQGPGPGGNWRSPFPHCRRDSASWWRSGPAVTCSSVIPSRWASPTTGARDTASVRYRCFTVATRSRKTAFASMFRPSPRALSGTGWTGPRAPTAGMRTTFGAGCA